MRKIDVHGHLGVWNFPIPNAGTPEALLRHCEKYDVAHVACSSVLAICYDMQEGNEELAEAFEPHPELLGYVYCNPNYLEESVTEMERYLGLDTFAARTQFPLTRPANHSTIVVTVDEHDGNGPQTIPEDTDGSGDGWEYDANSNSIVFGDDVVPGRGATITVTYETTCL